MAARIGHRRPGRRLAPSAPHVNVSTQTLWLSVPPTRILSFGAEQLSIDRQTVAVPGAITAPMERCMPIFMQSCLIRGLQAGWRQATMAASGQAAITEITGPTEIQISP